MAEVKKVEKPATAASPRPCALVSPDKGNAPTVVPALITGMADDPIAQQEPSSTSV